jgi:hypothetical protein
MFDPFVDSLVRGRDARHIGQVGGVRLVGGGAIVGDGRREGGLVLVVELLEACALFLPMTGVGLLDEQQDGEREAEPDSRDALPVEEA